MQLTHFMSNSQPSREHCPELTSIGPRWGFVSAPVPHASPPTTFAQTVLALKFEITNSNPQCRIIRGDEITEKKHNEKPRKVLNPICISTHIPCWPTAEYASTTGCSFWLWGVSSILAIVIIFGYFAYPRTCARIWIWNRASRLHIMHHERYQPTGRAAP